MDQLVRRGMDSEIGTISNTALEASTLMASGKTFTQVYSDYTKLQGELMAEKRETQRLTECLEHILSELKEKAPGLARLKEENESLKKKVALLHENVDALTLSNQDIQTSVQQGVDRMAVLDSENKSLYQEANDLGRQVQVLLRELENARMGPGNELNFSSLGGSGMGSVQEEMGNSNV